jgi:hypothetical protein
MFGSPGSKLKPAPATASMAQRVLVLYSIGLIAVLLGCPCAFREAAAHSMLGVRRGHAQSFAPSEDVSGFQEHWYA